LGSSFGFSSPWKMSTSSRRPRSCVMKFDPHSLLALWEPLAKLRKCPFSWEGTDYPNSKRGLAPDLKSLHDHKGALQPLLEMCPNGYPSHTNLRFALEKLHSKFDLFGPTADVHRVCSTAADRSPKTQP
jgi:hypothetical protein